MLSIQLHPTWPLTPLHLNAHGTQKHQAVTLTSSDDLFSPWSYPSSYDDTWPLGPSAPLPLYHNRSTAVTVDQFIASHGYNLCKDLLSLRVMKPIQNSGFLVTLWSPFERLATTLIHGLVTFKQLYIYILKEDILMCNIESMHHTFLNALVCKHANSLLWDGES